MKKNLFLFCCMAVMACNDQPKQNTTDVKYKTTGSVEKLDPALDAIIDTAAKAEIIAEGFEWSEGPLWIEKHNMLLFSDVPTNTIYKWTEEKGKEVYLKPSGYTGETPSESREPGSNGLTLDKNGNLVLCQHGNRQMARMDAPLDKPEAKYITIAGTYNGKRFSSPNDAVYNSQGELFFTDPPYGLGTQDDTDPKKETPFNGVYKVTVAGETVLVTDSITRPNGIAFLPGEKTLLVASSDGAKPNWYAFDVNDHGTFSNGGIFYSAIGSSGEKGLPDGFKVDKQGNVFATGPGGIWIFNKEGKLLGKYKVPEATSNCALSPDERTLYITNDMYLLRLKMR
ncbi:MAG: SMP-30/gluconolactonase/LRE family protein [Chitinophagaceae bacterium]|nr:SMP-30/gluconolactonase/LRE family protein [Chitinophagaceae bacterium]